MQEKNYLSIIIFVLIVFALLIGGNYLIRNKGSISTTKINDIRLDKNNDYVYFSDSDTVSEELDLVYNTIHLNIDNKDAKKLEEELNKYLFYYENDYIKYDILESTNYITIGVVKGHLNITSDVDNNTLKYYTFKKSDGHIMSMDEIKSAGKIKNSDILDTEKSYLEDKIDTEIKSYELYMDKYENVRMNMLVNSGDITYNDTVKIN